MYDVDKKDMKKDIENFSKALKKFMDTSIEQRIKNAKKARERLKFFHPEIGRAHV